MDFRLAFEPIRALGVAVRLLGRAPLTLLVGGILLFLTDPESLLELSGDHENYSMQQLLALAWISLTICGLGLVLFLVNSLLLVGYAGAVQRVMVSGEERIQDLFQDRGLWFSMVLARVMKLGLFLITGLPFYVLVGLPVIVAAHLGMGGAGWIFGIVFGLAYLPVWCYVNLGFVLVEEALAVEGLRPVEAVQRSWDVAEGNRIQLLLYSLSMLLVEYVGLLLCCVTACLGWALVPLAQTWTRIAWYESYLRMALPPPDDGMWVDHQRQPGS